MATTEKDRERKIRARAQRLWRANDVEPVEEAKIMENLGEFPGRLTDQGDRAPCSHDEEEGASVAAWHLRRGDCTVYAGWGRWPRRSGHGRARWIDAPIWSLHCCR